MVGMANRTLSTSVDEKVAKIVDDLAQVEDRSPSQIVASALRLYLRLPLEAHRAFRVVEAAAEDPERLAVIREITRVLLNGECAVARRRVAASLTIDRELGDEDAAMEEALRMTREATRA
jgi:predicted transcriptional regulator